MKEINKINKRAITRIGKIAIAAQFVLVIGVLAFIYFCTPKLDYPRNNEVLSQSAVELKFRNARVVLIDENPDFTSPREIDTENAGMANITFQPGVYYWKAVGILESSAKRFTIPSEVGLELDNEILRNSGNVPVNVSVENEFGLSGLAILDIKVEYEVNESEKAVYRGEQHGG
ncbi:MAG: hypothetical protein KKE50_06610 [Nanoarchaeota archaeon]|nr:hypothetical protein [Nanoarchaeota archaeon]